MGHLPAPFTEIRCTGYRASKMILVPPQPLSAKCSKAGSVQAFPLPLNELGVQGYTGAARHLLAPFVDLRLLKKFI